MKRRLGQFLKILSFLALGVLLLYFAFRGVAFDELASILKRVDFRWIGLSLLFAAVSFFLRSRRWMLLIEPLGFKPSFRNTYHSLMVGYLSNFALPRLGELTRCVTLGKREKIPADSLFGTVIVERVIDLVMLMLIMLILLINWMDKFATFFKEEAKEQINNIFGGTWVLFLILFASIIILLALAYILRKQLMRFSMIHKLKEILIGVLNGLKTIYRMKRKWEFIFHSILIWFLYIMMTWVVVFSLDELSGLTFVDGMFLLVIGGLGMSAPVTAGLGAYHYITSRGLMVVYEFSKETGNAYAILAHESNSLLTILLGALSYTLLMTSRKQIAPVKNQS